MIGLAVHPDVRQAEADGRTILLDLKSEEYFVLDPVATQMWRQVAAGRGREESVAALAVTYEVERPRLEADFDAFVRRCLEDGLLTDRPVEAPASSAVSRRAATRWLFLRAWWSLRRTSRGLAREGFARTYRSCAGLSRPAEPRDPARALAAFAAAENFYTLRRAPQDCLPRSLALFRFLRAAGAAAEHVIGVRQFPFQAHAWVEVDGRVVHDDPANRKLYVEIARIR